MGRLLCCREDRHATSRAGFNCSARRQVDEGRGPLPILLENLGKRAAE